MALGRERSDSPQQGGLRQSDEKAQPDQRSGLQSTLGKLRIISQQQLVEVRDVVLELGADAADKKVVERRQAAEQDNRSVFDLAVGLR